MTQLDNLDAMSAEHLRTTWKEDLGRPPPPRASEQYMRSVLAYRVQEKAGPKLSKAIVRHLERLSKPNTNIDVIQAPVRQLSEGSSLLREWNGETHEVQVLEKGFEYRTQRYRSLSAIAREITGTRWSGPAFFGLKDRENANAA